MKVGVEPAFRGYGEPGIWPGNKIFFSARGIILPLSCFKVNPFPYWREKLEFFWDVRSDCKRAVLRGLVSQSDAAKSGCSRTSALFGPDLESCPFRKLGDLLIFQSDHRPNVAFSLFLYSQFSRSPPRNAATGIGRTFVLPTHYKL